MSKRGVLASICLLALGCGHALERQFFEQYLGTRLERLRQYGLNDQYKIFRYGNHMEPPLSDLAIPIAEKGATVVPFLLNRLSEADDEGVRDSLTVFETMVRDNYYDVKSDATVMNALSSRIATVKDKWQRDFYLQQLEYIRSH